MDTLSVLTFIGGLMIAIIGFFLKRTMDELKEVKILAADTSTKLEVMKKGHDLQLEFLSDKFDDLEDAMKDLTKEIKELNKSIKK